jgi:hypothetical protein
MIGHLGHDKHGRPVLGPGNVRNGTSPKTVLADSSGEVPIDVLRGGRGRSEPHIVRKHRYSQIVKLNRIRPARRRRAGRVAGPLARCTGRVLRDPPARRGMDLWLLRRCPRGASIGHAAADRIRGEDTAQRTLPCGIPAALVTQPGPPARRGDQRAGTST